MVKHLLGMLTLAVALAASLGGSARADELVLKSGDRLSGEVSKVGDDYLVRHALLGELTLPGKDVARVIRGTSPAGAATGSAAPLAPTCTRCPVPEPEKESARKRPWTFWIGVGLTNDAGNTVKFQWNLDTEASYTWGRNTLRGRVNWFYEESQHVQTEGKLFANAVYERMVSPRGKLFAMWLIDRDDFADILYRTGWFVGYGYDFIQREKTTLTGKVGAGVIVESRPNTAVIQTPAFLASLDFRHEFRTGDTFRAYAYVIPYVEYTERSPLRLELQYAHPLRDHLDITAGFLLDYVPDPPNDILAYDTKITFGIRWKP